MPTEAEKPVLFHLHLSDTTPIDEEEITLADGKTAKVLWKDVLVEGEYPMSPSKDGATSTPMTVITDGESDVVTKTISMSDLEFAHREAAHKYVTIPTTHRDQVLDNTGYVPQPDGLRRVTKRGKTVLQAALGFTEPDVKGKVQRGTIPDVSAGIFFNFMNKARKQRYRSSMKHVALTPTPFMGNLDPFPAVFASDDDIPDDVTVEIYNLAEGEPASGSEGGSKDSAEIVWNEKLAASWVSKRVNEQLNPQPSPEEMAADLPRSPQPSYYVQDISTDDTALVEEYFKGKSTRFVVPFKREDDDIVVAPSTRWVEVREAMIAASDTDFEDTSSVLEKLSLELGEMLGKTDAVYRVDALSLDGRAHIVCRAKGREWITRFFALSDGSYWLTPAEQWEELSPTPRPKEVITPAGASDRLAAARHHRRHLVV
jgi:hypothetical protein